MSSYSPFAKHSISDVNQMSSSHNPFDDNYHGILTHNGEIKVAKGDIEQEIIYIDDDGIVLVDGGKKAYQTIIHTKLLSLIQYAKEGDTALVKFIKGESYIVGFRKNKRGNRYGKCNP